MAQTRTSQRVVLWLVVAGISYSLGYYTRYALTRQETAPTKPVFAFVAGGSNAYWEMATAGAREAAESHDVEVAVCSVARVRNVIAELVSIVWIVRV